MSVKAIPAGHHTVTPYLAIKNAAKALEFYKTAFGATETYKLMMPDGRLGHAEIRLGDSMIMMSDEFPEYGGNAPETLGGSPVSIHLYVEDVDAFFKKAPAVPKNASPSWISFTEIAPASSKILLVISGGSPPIRKTSRQTRCESAWKRWLWRRNREVRERDGWRAVS